jgi:hypothetical protein
MNARRAQRDVTPSSIEFRLRAAVQEPSKRLEHRRPYENGNANNGHRQAVRQHPHVVSVPCGGRCRELPADAQRGPRSCRHPIAAVAVRVDRGTATAGDGRDGVCFAGAAIMAWFDYRDRQSGKGRISLSTGIDQPSDCGGEIPALHPSECKRGLWLRGFRPASPGLAIGFRLWRAVARSVIGRFARPAVCDNRATSAGAGGGLASYDLRLMGSDLRLAGRDLWLASLRHEFRTHRVSLFQTDVAGRKRVLNWNGWTDRAVNPDV